MHKPNILLTGPANVGKTTVGIELAKHLGAVLVEADNIRNTFVARELRNANTYQRKTVIDIILASIEAYSANGHRVILTEAVFTIDDFKSLTKQIKDMYPLLIIGLTCSYDEISGPRNKYIDNKHMCAHLRDSFDINSQAAQLELFDHIVDTSKDLHSTVREIIHHLHAKA